MAHVDQSPDALRFHLALMGNDDGEFTRPVIMSRADMMALINKAAVPPSLAMVGMRLQLLLAPALEPAPVSAPEI